MSGVFGKFLLLPCSRVDYLSVLCCKKSLFPWPLEHLGSEKPRNPLAAPALQVLVIYAAASGIAADFSGLVNICQVYGKWKSLRLSFAARKWPPVIWVEILIHRAKKPTPLESSHDFFPDPLTLTPLLADVAPMSLLLSSILHVLVAPFPDPAAAPDPAPGFTLPSPGSSFLNVACHGRRNVYCQLQGGNGNRGKWIGFLVSGWDRSSNALCWKINCNIQDRTKRLNKVQSHIFCGLIYYLYFLVSHILGVSPI